ncbi:MAG: PhzF family phenazine biosynthesis protein [Peptococcaceae bacterium]|jgi:PhzF family phenazine biosynthesis protein|nr:PhzF family phenazine biosynthesis protein [Peptococcaceae bacterium]
MKFFIVDAFAEEVFRGNQAGVCLVDKPLDDQTMQNIAAENNLAETAFITQNGSDFDLRWFSPEVEIDLCGHATLASAYVISRFVNENMGTVYFNTLSGKLSVTPKGDYDDYFEMDFPARKPTKTTLLPLMREAVECPVLEAHRSRDLLLLLPDENAIRTLKPHMDLIRRIQDCFAVIVTARGDEADFVSRFFAPNAGMPEDPVTGSSHSTLIPFWAERLGKQQMTAKQLSKRGGVLRCEDCGDRVKISGRAVLYLTGEIFV